MKGDSAGEIGTTLQNSGISIDVLVGDDDSSAIKRLREEYGKDIVKSSDLNHVKKDLGNHLYKVKPEGHNELSDKVTFQLVCVAVLNF